MAAARVSLYHPQTKTNYEDDRILQTNSPKTNCPRRIPRRRIPKTNSKKTNCPPEMILFEDEFRRRIPRRWLVPRRRITSRTRILKRRTPRRRTTPRRRIEDEFRRRIPKTNSPKTSWSPKPNYFPRTNSPKTNGPPKTNYIYVPKTNSEDEFPEDELPPEEELYELLPEDEFRRRRYEFRIPEDGFRRRIPGSQIVLRRRVIYIYILPEDEFPEDDLPPEDEFLPEDELLPKTTSFPKTRQRSAYRFENVRWGLHMVMFM